MNDLKGWWKREEIDSNVWEPSFIKLFELIIVDCDKLVSFPTCPRLEKLRLHGVNKELQLSLGKEEGLIKLREVKIDNLDCFESLRTQSLTSLCILKNNEVESFSELGETLFKSCFTLKRLSITECSSLRSLNGRWWKHLNALELLELSSLPQLTSLGNNDADDNDVDENDGTIPWRSLDRSLRWMRFIGLGIKILPKGMQYLTSLDQLLLGWCNDLECLPEWISCLSSLQILRIYGCKKLSLLSRPLRDLTSLRILHVRSCPLVVAKRFLDPDGDDWVNLRHIATIQIC
ncbi:hypothetical protein RND81_14G229000 [Saponaria officinalis]|uniref:Uncharacterized protein n=1 Tax=Saponaria officinalis TaxID=3572 RepID=A0AAW1GQL0_SAPOF